MKHLSFFRKLHSAITTDVEEGVREVSIRQGGNSLWSNRVQVLKEVWLTPELGRLKSLHELTGIQSLLFKEGL